MEENKKEQKKPQNTGIAMIIFVIIVVIVGGFFLYSYQKQNIAKTQPESKPTQAPVVNSSVAPIISTQYSCEADKSITAVFDNSSSVKTVDLTLSDGKTLTLIETPSASGARYANEDESIVFWSKGDTAFIEENGEQTYTNCVVTS
jgi:membrane-bound inhibitor of C-type lysozyme